MNVYSSDTEDHFHSKCVSCMAPDNGHRHTREVPLVQIPSVGVTESFWTGRRLPRYTETSWERRQGKKNNLLRYIQTLRDPNCKQLRLINLYLLVICYSSLKGNSGRWIVMTKLKSVMQIQHAGPQRLEKCAPRTAFTENIMCRNCLKNNHRCIMHIYACELREHVCLRVCASLCRRKWLLTAVFWWTHIYYIDSIYSVCVCNYSQTHAM